MKLPCQHFTKTPCGARRYFSSQFDGRPWRWISPDFKIIRVPGRHYDWVTVHARALAHYLRDPLSIPTRAATIGELPPLSDRFPGRIGGT